MRSPWRFFYALSAAVLGIVAVTSTALLLAEAQSMAYVFAAVLGAGGVAFVTLAARVLGNGVEMRHDRILAKSEFRTHVYEVREMRSFESVVDRDFGVVHRWALRVITADSHSDLVCLLGFSSPGRRNQRLEHQVDALNEWLQRAKTST